VFYLGSSWFLLLLYLGSSCVAAWVHDIWVPAWIATPGCTWFSIPRAVGEGRENRPGEGGPQNQPWKFGFGVGAPVTDYRTPHPSALGACSSPGRF
jgi:hypothetical protein